MTAPSEAQRASHGGDRRAATPLEPRARRGRRRQGPAMEEQTMRSASRQEPATTTRRSRIPPFSVTAERTVDLPVGAVVVAVDFNDDGGFGYGRSPRQRGPRWGRKTPPTKPLTGPRHFDGRVSMARRRVARAVAPEIGPTASAGAPRCRRQRRVRIAVSASPRGVGRAVPHARLTRSVSPCRDLAGSSSAVRFYGVDSSRLNGVNRPRTTRPARQPSVGRESS
jgi:hypothetical protein